MNLFQMMEWCKSPNTHRAMEIDYDRLLNDMAAIIQKKPIDQIVKDYDDALDLMDAASTVGHEAWEAAILHVSAVKLAHDRKQAH